MQQSVSQQLGVCSVGKGCIACTYNVDALCFKHSTNSYVQHGGKGGGESSNTDGKAAEGCWETQDGLIVEQSHLPEKTLTLDATSSSWKQIHKSPLIYEKIKILSGLKALQENKTWGP